MYTYYRASSYIIHNYNQYCIMYRVSNREGEALGSSYPQFEFSQNPQYYIYVIVRKHSSNKLAGYLKF